MKNKVKEKVRTAKGRKTGSTRWLKRQINDPYVERAKQDGYRGRAAYKLLEINEKIDFLKDGQTIVDLGAAPGGWCQIAVEKGCTKIVAIDLLEMDEVPGADFVQMDFMDDDAPDHLKGMLSDNGQDGLVDVVMSDILCNDLRNKAFKLFVSGVGAAFALELSQTNCPTLLISAMLTCNLI